MTGRSGRSTPLPWRASACLANRSVWYSKQEGNVMSRFHKRILSALIVAAMAGGIWVVELQASADVLSCPQQTNAVRVWDRERNSCGILAHDNTDWRNIGSPAWNDRIDQFGNDDFVGQRTMCLYRDIHFVPVESAFALPVGWMVTWNNTVSSNRWTFTGC